ncbi:hypothetical protein EDB92DRAFT_306095 [Lactarius akahatsu]|uniref:Uncharacterized protein n=1 Tax=Lactarius akahatsu TaxID=416441 RepID=A0AAD4L7H1_9AGAM|nr:hypothetical protein EDB92DRAFT_306095 [Lactarius akahatsu]
MSKPTRYPTKNVFIHRVRAQDASCPVQQQFVSLCHGVPIGHHSGSKDFTLQALIGLIWYTDFKSSIYHLSSFKVDNYFETASQFCVYGLRRTLSPGQVGRTEEKVGEVPLKQHATTRLTSLYLKLSPLRRASWSAPEVNHILNHNHGLVYLPMASRGQLVY